MGPSADRRYNKPHRFGSEARPLSLRPAHHRPMIDLGTISGLLEHDHELHAYCPHCQRWRVLNLEAMVRSGRGLQRLPFTVRCRDCGQIGQLQVRPPTPTRSTTGWITPPH